MTNERHVHRARLPIPPRPGRLIPNKYSSALFHFNHPFRSSATLYGVVLYLYLLFNYFLRGLSQLGIE